MFAISVQLFVIMTIANILIYSGLAFINGRLWPEGMQAVYQFMPSINVRLLVAMLTFFLLANMLFAMGYRMSLASLAGVFHIVTGIVIMIIMALLLDGSRMNLLAFAGLSLMIAGGTLVVLGLARG